MDTTQVYNYIVIGLRLRFLQGIHASTPIETVLTEISHLKGDLEKNGFEVSLVLFSAGSVEGLLTELENEGKNSPIGEGLSVKLGKVVNEIETTLFAEASIKRAYTVPQRRYNGTYLAENNAKLLDETTFEEMSETARRDFSSACKCLLYGEATAVAFHILRATEDTLKCYYLRLKKTKRLKKPMWGTMTSELKTMKRNKPSKVILDSLDLVRESYRNPTQHPEAFYSIEEAQNLFGVCIDLINKLTVRT